MSSYFQRVGFEQSILSGDKSLFSAEKKQYDPEEQSARRHHITNANLQNNLSSSDQKNGSQDASLNQTRISKFTFNQSRTIKKPNRQFNSNELSV